MGTVKNITGYKANSKKQRGKDICSVAEFFLVLQPTQHVYQQFESCFIHILEYLLGALADLLHLILQFSP